MDMGLSVSALQMYTLAAAAAVVVVLFFVFIIFAVVVKEKSCDGTSNSSGFSGERGLNDFCVRGTHGASIPVPLRTLTLMVQEETAAARSAEDADGLGRLSDVLALIKVCT